MPQIGFSINRTTVLFCSVPRFFMCSFFSLYKLFATARRERKKGMHSNTQKQTQTWRRLTFDLDLVCRAQREKERETDNLSLNGCRAPQHKVNTDGWMDCRDEMARFYYSQWDATFLLQSKKKNVLLAIDLLKKKKTAVSKDTVKKFCVPYLDAQQTVFSLVCFVAASFYHPPLHH